MEDLTSVIVGYGHAGGYHEESYPPNVRIVGVVDSSPGRQEKAISRGYRVFSNLEEALTGVAPDIWDICLPTEFHFSAMETILNEHPDANIIVEKPVCQPNESQKATTLPSTFPKAKIVVQENYLSSQITERIKEVIAKHNLQQYGIVNESTKNRVKDVLNGRYLDKGLFVFGYETPHQLTAVLGIAEEFREARLTDVRTDDMKLPDGRVLNRQGQGQITYTTSDGREIIVYTSMTGKVGYTIPEFTNIKTIGIGDETRYRVMIVSSDDVQVVGQYSPVHGLTNYQGRVYVKAGNKILERYEPLDDRSMDRHLKRAIKYFVNGGQNPAPVDCGVFIVDILAQAIRKLSTS